MGRLLPSFIILSLLAATGAEAQTLQCGPLLDRAVDAPIPQSAIAVDDRLVLFARAAESRALLPGHVASVAIDEMPGAYVGLSANVRTCRAEGCDAFVYVTSNGVGALTDLMRIDGATILDTSDYRSGVPDQAIWPDVFVRHWIGPADQVFASIRTPSFYVRVIWAGVAGEVGDVGAWLTRLTSDLVARGESVTIPYYAISQHVPIGRLSGC